MTATARLLVQCPDGRGITAAVTRHVADFDGNLLDLEQHTDPDHGEFMLRAVLETSRSIGDLARGFESVATRYGMNWRLVDADRPLRMVVLTGPQLHCLVDLLYRAATDDLPATVVGVASNHATAERAASQHGVPFHLVEVEETDPGRHFDRMGTLLEELEPDLVVLARYMRIMPSHLVQRWSERMINVHHSFLPAFPGADPYRQAYARGVKLVGATAHYATEDLDEGPIIAQAAAPIDHHESVADLKRIGADLERLVLADAVRAHLEDRIMVKDGRTIVFR